MILSLALLVNASIFLYIAMNFLKKLGQIKSDLGYLDHRLETSRQDLKSHLYHIEAMMIQIRPEDKEDKPRPANRKPRTDAQKEASSKKRKEWWERKRREQKAPGEVAIQTAASSD